MNYIATFDEALVDTAPIDVPSAAFIILSGEYVGPELVAEFGRLPPSMLPNGGQPLYEAQCDMADALGASPVIVLPEDFTLSSFDLERFAQRGLAVAWSSSTMSLVDSLRVGLDARPAAGAFLLFGDTLVANLRSWPSDSFAAGETSHVAAWAGYTEEAGRSVFHDRPPEATGSGDVVAGFFHFSDSMRLLELAQNAESLTDLLNRYSAERPLSASTNAEWLDFGHLFTYHQSRCRELLARSFNSVVSDGHSVVKSGTPARKIFAEAEWYKQLPARLRPFAPHFMGDTDAQGVSYEVEYLYLPLMSELYSFAHLPMSTWVTMIDSCCKFLQTMHAITPASHHVPADFHRFFFDDMIGAKTEARLHAFARERDLCQNRAWTLNGKPFLSLKELADHLIAMIRPSDGDDISFWHGDFHFGNIFYDFRSRKVRVVDPRGLLPNGMLTVYGDARYDISKLGHSIYGLYDMLIAGRYHLQSDNSYDVTLDFGPDPRREEIIALYSGLKIGRYATADREAIAMVALLFLSMLPLHATDRRRQLALLANAMRLARMAEDAR